MEEIAKTLNSIIEGTVIEELLSSQGKRLYFPHGIVSQSQEASKAKCTINATAGVALKSGHYITHPIFEECDGLVSTDEMVSYAPTSGLLALRKEWDAHIQKENPILKQRLHSLPVVTSGLTHAISLISQLFIDENTDIAVIDPSWDNYHLIFEVVHQAKIHSLPLFDIHNWKNICNSCKKEKIVFLFNFPNNPTGFTPSNEQMIEISEFLLQLAEKGKKILVIVDDAYFGLFHTDTCARQSLFSYISDLHENLLAVKCDAATKESLVWGFRVGFITYAGKNLTYQHYESLIEKTKGAIRATISSASMVSQSLLLKVLRDSSYSSTVEGVKSEMKKRYEKVIDRVKFYEGEKFLTPLPANSGYFISFYYKGDALQLRATLLKEGIGIISLGEHIIRIAYSAVNIEAIDQLVDTLFEGAKTLWK